MSGLPQNQDKAKGDCRLCISACEELPGEPSGVRILEKDHVQVMHPRQRRTEEAAKAWAVFHYRLVEEADAVAAAHQLLDELEGAYAGAVRERCGAVALLRQLIFENAPCAGALLPQDQALVEQLLDRSAMSCQRVHGTANADIRLRAQKEAVIALFVKNALKHDKVQLSRFQLGQQVRGVVHQKEQLIPELTPCILHEFVEKIVIHAATDPHSKINRRQEVDIYHKGVGILEMSKVVDSRQK